MSDRGEDRPAEAEAARAPARPDAALQLATAAVAVLAVIFAVVGFVGFGGRAGLGVGIGGAIAVANLVVFVHVVRGMLAGGHRGRIWVLVGILKIFVLFGGVWWVLSSGVTSPLALICGYGALPLGIGLGGALGPKVPPGDPEQDPSSPTQPDRDKPTSGG
ncbi:MAG: ATP synthase subunit I [Deltaproteobacteria bacterium]|jgi:hypothetical protein|nr:ATP synthase subunit I [Deltaproteobacteria bacterium]MBW2534254.1 ATP synthase subunit I [Deltaproteobacteria bacterium]